MRPLPDRAEAFLEAHPELGVARAAAVWPRIRDEARILPGPTGFLIGSDTFGSEAALLLDRLARGARAEGSDPLSRELFLELPESLRDLVRVILLRQPARPTDDEVP